MKAKDIRELPVQELQAKESEIQKEFFDIQFRSHTDGINQGSKRKMLRKDFARIKTILREKRGK
ncbi:MAG: 50S ribosomal protein L29 [Deltaproteobacteria bacterium]